VQAKQLSLIRIWDESQLTSVNLSFVSPKDVEGDWLWKLEGLGSSTSPQIGKHLEGINDFALQIKLFENRQ